MSTEDVRRDVVTRMAEAFAPALAARPFPPDPDALARTAFQYAEDFYREGVERGFYPTPSKE